MPSRGAAIVFGDDHVLRHVDQTPRQVTGVGRLERGIRQTLARAVRRDEVLQHVEAFAEVRRDRGFDDFARRLGHQTAHTGKLADLLFRTARAGVGHDVNRIEVAAGAVVLFHGAEHLIRNLLGNVGPDFDDLVVALAVGDGAVLILASPPPPLPSRRSPPARPSRPARPCRRRRSKCPRASHTGSPRFLTSSSIWTVICRPNFR